VIRATTSDVFSVSAGLVNADNTMETGATVNYTIRVASDDSEQVASTGMTESAVVSGLYYVNLTIATAGDYRAYISSAGFPSVTEDIEITPAISDIATLSTDVKRLLGLTHENVYIDTTVYDAQGNLTSGRLRTYSVAGSVGTDSDVLATYTITAVTAGAINQFTNFKVVKQ